MKVIQLSENSTNNQFIFCIENEIGFTWKNETGNILHPKHISIEEYVATTSNCIKLGDFNEHTK